ncbi:hypothetical protein SUGI_0290050 [Cryptomeria japonica]|uniref:uncharacterized protein LOC131033767 n=1 Tax=Cryptomeria japonica TaxID=3369 RepID=UPI002408B051|nr:uncharacterized protein LOC131033767 [Cryptomeria japonica]XP_057821037.2 uncharacterized protein LOC131033767 [Cryptomeria japonica]XP_057821038.2 uncharacterized protein LOC131033767 [Cryptomeria japonica]GLJ16829.1 hypothetical protein SUGI_0290050 [Cryptomeria japonica]
MPRGSRNKSHKQHHKQSVKDLEDSDEGENTRYGPELLPEPKLEGKRGREDGKVDSSREKHEIQKRKSQPQPRELGPGSSSATYFPAKRKRGAVESLEVVEANASVISVSVDRWNGGEMQGDALSLLPYHSRTDSESSGRNVGGTDDKDDVRTEDKVKKSIKGRVPDTGAGSAKIDVSESIHNVKGGRSKGSKRKETQDSAVDQGNSVKLAEESSLKMDSEVFNIGKLELAKSGTKGRWDKGIARKESKEADEGTGASSRDAQRGSEREKKVRNLKPEKTTDSLAGPAKTYESHKNEGFLEESSIKQEQKNTEWQLQEEVRNIELEKELENRIQRRRREESGERDRWRDDDRDLEGKRFYRDERKKDDRYKDEKQRDDRYKDDRHKDDRNKDDKYREEKYLEDRQRGDKHQENKHRDLRLSRERTTEKYDSKHSRDGTKVPESHYKENKNGDSDRDYSSHYDDQYNQPKDHHNQNRPGHAREESKEAKTHANKASFAEGDCRGLITGHQDVNRDHENSLLVLPSSEAGDSFTDKKVKRVHEFVSEIHKEERRLKFKQSDQFSKNVEQLTSHSREPGILHSKSKTDKKMENHRDESPLGSAKSSAYEGRTSPVLSHIESSPKNNGRLSPFNLARKSPSSHVQEHGHSLSYEKTVRKNKFETVNNVSGAGGMRNRSSYYSNASDRDKQLSVTDEIVSREPLASYKSTEDHRRSPSTERVNDSQMNNSSVDDSLRVPYGRVGSAQDSRRMLSGGNSASYERPSKSRRLEEGSSSRSDWTVHPTPMNRPMDSSIRPQVPSLTGRASGLLPPPPPFRPGIDNPAILGSSSSGFDEAPSSRDQRRSDRQISGHFKRGEVMGGSGQVDVWKGVGNWNSHGQGQGPANMFLPFQHHIGGHPHGPFLNIGQQFPGPPLFGVRPSADMGNVRYHVRDGGDAFPGHNRTHGWQRQTDDVCGPHIQVPLHGWEGPGSYGEESHAYGRPDRDQIGQGISARSWDRAMDMWKANPRETDEAWGGPQVPRGRLEKIRRERSPTESIEIKRSDESPPKVMKENQCSIVSSDIRKQNKNKCDRRSVYLSKLDISADLAGLELYNECADMLDSRENVITNDDTILKDGLNEDATKNFQLEVNADAEALLQSLNIHSMIFSSLSKEVFERAFAIYKNATGETKLEPAANSHSNLSMGGVQKVTVAFESSKEGPLRTNLYDKTNAAVVAIAPENTFKGLASAMELQTSQGDYDVKNQLQTSRDYLDMALQDDAKGNVLCGGSNVKEPVVNVNDMGNLPLLDDADNMRCSESVEAVNARGFPVEPADDVANLELLAGHGPLGLSGESVAAVDAIVFLEEPSYGINFNNAMNFAEEQLDYVDPIVLEETNKVSYDAKESVLIEDNEEDKSVSSKYVGKTDVGGIENSPKEYSAAVENCAMISESGKVSAVFDFSVGVHTQSVRMCEVEAESDCKMHNSETVEVSECCERRDDTDLRFTDPNKLVEIKYAEARIQEDENSENPDIVLENAVESVDTKIGIQNFSPYNLPGSTH